MPDISDYRAVCRPGERGRGKWLLKGLACNAVLLCLAAVMTRFVELEDAGDQVRADSVELRITGALTETVAGGLVECQDEGLYEVSVSSGENIRLSVSVTVSDDGLEATVIDWVRGPSGYRNVSGEGVTVRSGSVVFASAPFRAVAGQGSGSITVTGGYECPGLFSEL